MQYITQLNTTQYNTTQQKSTKIDITHNKKYK